MKYCRPSFLTIIFTILLISAFSTTSAQSETIKLDSWITTEVVHIPHAIIDEDFSANQLENLLTTLPVNISSFWPEQGEKIQFGPWGDTRFASGSLDFGGYPSSKANEMSVLEKVSNGDGGTWFSMAATYLDSPEWQKATLSLEGDAAVKLFLDGEEVFGRTAVMTDDEENLTDEITLDQGRHVIILATAINAEELPQAWDFQISLESEQVLPKNTIDPKHPFDITDYFMQESISDMMINHKGTLVAVKRGSWIKEENKKEYKLEIWDISKGKVIWNYVQSGSFSLYGWAPDDSGLLIKMTGVEGTDLNLWNEQDNSFKRIAKGLQDASSFTWAPDGKGLYFTKNVAYEESENPYKVMWSLEDRWTGWRDLTQVCYLGLSGQTEVVLVEGRYDPDNLVVTPDGSKLVIQRSIPYTERPFELVEFFTIDTKTGQSEKIYEENFQTVSGMAISPDGTKLAFAAPRFPVTGNNNENPAINYYDKDLYILDLETGEATNVSPDFDPAVDIIYYGTGRGNDEAFTWHDDGHLIFPALHNKKAYFCVYFPESGNISTQLLETPGFSNLTVATGKKARTVVYSGDITAQLSDVYWYNTKKKKGGKLFVVSQELKKRTTPPTRVDDYDYVNSDGVTVPGYLYYPENYDPEQSYPMVIDTYGGVIGFGDGWMWGSSVYASRGYFCYIPVPRGAAGYGSEFADTHPNDWGELTSRDINEGVRHIVENVPGVDGERVGFVSGSYGGFLAMYLLAMPKDHKDYYPYATAISDYGISNLASYWGKGWWGYLYCDMASAGSFPWNAQQWYIDHSPLYWADNITAPLLLVHGDSDNNVPVMESDQMYTALKVLDREVAFVRFPGEDHGVAGKRTSYITSKKMHIEWFDKYLKNQAGAWDDRMEDEKK